MTVPTNQETNTVLLLLLASQGTAGICGKIFLTKTPNTKTMTTRVL